MQADLFGGPQAAPSIPGLRYEADFLSAEDEAQLLAVIGTLPLQPAPYKSYEARRRIVSFGHRYDFDANLLRPGLPLDERLLPLRERVAAWLGVAPQALAQVLVSEYQPGTPLGWHRDVPEFETIAGVSLAAPAVLRFRPYPPDALAKRKAVQLEVAPRSIYRMAGEARWGWQHAVPAVQALRFSITFRTRRAGGAGPQAQN